MSVVAQVVAASVTPTPSASPVVQVIQVVQAHAATGPSAWTQLTDELNKLSSLLSPYIVLIGAALASGVQVLLNKFPFLSHDIKEVQDFRRKMLAVAIPVVGTLVAGLATGQNTLNLAPWVFLIAQILFASVKALQAAGAAYVANQPTLATEEVSQG